MSWGGSLYVLGAGASASVMHRVLLGRDLMDFAATELGGTPSFGMLSRFICDCTHSRSRPKGLPPLDEIATLIDAAVLANGSLGDKYGATELIELKKAVVDLLSEVIIRGYGISQIPDDSFSSFVAHIVDHRHMVASFNWDCILDRIWCARSKSACPDYGFPYYTKAGELRSEGSGFGCKIIKPHGALNWLRCTKCDAVTVIDAEGIRDSNVSCGNCRSMRTERLIVTPTMHKAASHPALRRSSEWLLEGLHSCARLIFVGYSMPPQDAHVLYTLIKGISSRPKRPDVTVVDWVGEGKTKDDCGAYLRHLRLLGEPIAFFSDFKEFIREEIEP